MAYSFDTHLLDFLCKGNRIHLLAFDFQCHYRIVQPEIFQNIEMESDGSIPPEVLHFNGKVKEIGDGNLLVTYISTADGFMELSDGDYVMSTDNLRDEVQKGDVVTIWFGGIILETAPAQLANVYRIEKAE